MEVGQDGREDEPKGLDHDMGDEDKKVGEAQDLVDLKRTQESDPEATEKTTEGKRGPVVDSSDSRTRQRQLTDVGQSARARTSAVHLT